MGFYRDQILPRAIDWVLRRRHYTELRKSSTEGLRGRVLEIGFGSGLNLPFYPPDVERIVAVDPATLGRRLAARRMAECHAPVEFCDLDGDGFPLGAATVDSILSTWTLCTIPEPGRALTEMRRVLKPSGRFHFLEHGVAPDPGVVRVQRIFDPIHGKLTGGCRLRLPIDRLIREAGFEIDALETFYSGGPRFLSYMYQGIAIKRS